MGPRLHPETDGIAPWRLWVQHKHFYKTEGWKKYATMRQSNKWSKSHTCLQRRYSHQGDSPLALPAPFAEAVRQVSPTRTQLQTENSPLRQVTGSSSTHNHLHTQQHLKNNKILHPCLLIVLTGRSAITFVHQIKNKSALSLNHASKSIAVQENVDRFRGEDQSTVRPAPSGVHWYNRQEGKTVDTT